MAKENSHMIKVVIIDFDDTLCLTEEACFHLENAVAEEMGFQPMSREVHKANWGQPLDIAIPVRVPGIDVPHFMEKLSVRLEQYVHEGKVDSIQDKNLEALDELLASGRRLAILTSRTYGEAKHLLDTNHPLNQRMEKIYHKDNSDFHKPDPRVFDKILADFEVAPHEAVYVGDAVTDAIAAKEAGLHFIAVLESGLRTPDDFSGKCVDLFVNSFTDVVPYLLRSDH
jgi:phosphoglycolate phosphatase